MGKCLDDLAIELIRRRNFLRVVCDDDIKVEGEVIAMMAGIPLRVDDNEDYITLINKIKKPIYSALVGCLPRAYYEKVNHKNLLK